MKQESMDVKYLAVLMLLAYIFSFFIRMIWVYQFQDNPNFFWNGELMINTNDGYIWASGVQNAMEGLHADNPRIPSIWDYGVVAITALFTKITPLSLDTVILYMPAVISSLVVIPIILIARLYGQSLWGFFAALLGSIAWSYYNRTMIGYYDTDMFSAMAPMFILYFLMKSTIDFNLRSALYAAIAITVYPFLYDQGRAIVYAMGIIYAVYMIFYHREDKTTYHSLILVFVALLPLPLAAPTVYIAKIFLLMILYIVLQKTSLEQKKLMAVSGILFLLFMYFGNVFGLILSKVMGYMSTGTVSEGLRFYGVKQTVREAGQIPFSMFANRISGSQVGVLASLIGYIILVLRYRAFILALPLIGIGVFALWGGLRFTVYAVPVAALSAVYVFYNLFDIVKENKHRVSVLCVISFIFFLEQFIGLIQKFIIPNQRGFIDAFLAAVLNVWTNIKQIFSTFDFGSINSEAYNILIPLFISIILAGIYLSLEKNKYKINKTVFISCLTCLMLLPNVTHIIGYKVPTVLNKAEVEDLVKLDSMADKKDYTLSWWDYGYPIWYYSNTNTLIDGGKHNNDNFIVSKIMQTSSSQLAASLSRLAVETYVDSNYKVVADTIFKNKQKDQIDPNLLLSELEHATYSLPKKTRDIYLYLPYRMMRIFPTVAVFGNLDLTIGQEERKIAFYPTQAVSNNEGMLAFRNGIMFDTKRGVVRLGKKEESVKYFIVTQNTEDGKLKLQSQLYHADGRYAVVYMQSYGQFIVMDTETFNSTYVQMFMLEKYDKDLFELVVSSPYSKIYKLKI